MNTYILVVVQGEDAGQTFTLEGPRVVLGRPGSGQDVDIEFQDLTVSRVHAVLDWSEPDGSYALSNRSLTSPARVDGQPATSRVVLAPGARLQLGDLVAEYRLPGGSDPGAAAADTRLMGVLERIEGGRLVARYQVAHRRTRIGRSGDCEVCLESTAVSRQHAVIEWFDLVPAVYSLTENSTTRVNGQAIPQGASLGPRDEILLGGEILLRWIPTEIMAEEEQRWQSLGAQALPPASHPEPDSAPAPRTSTTRPSRLRDLLLESPLAARVEFFKDLRTRIEKGQSMSTAVEAAGKTSLPRLASTLSDALLSGRDLAEAMAEFPGTFGAYEVSMVRAGEESGTLDTQLQVLVHSLEDAVALRQALHFRLRGPLIRSALVVLLALLPVLWRQGFHAWGVAAGGTLLAAAVLGLALFLLALQINHRPPLRVRVEDFLAGSSGFGKALRLQVGVRFLGVLGAMLESGLSMPQAARLAARCTGSLHHGQLLLESTDRLALGASVLDVLGSADFISQEILDRIGQGEDQGRLPEVLARISSDLRHEARAEMENLVSRLAGILLGLGVLLLLLGLAASRLLAF